MKIMNKKILYKIYVFLFYVNDLDYSPQTHTTATYKYLTTTTTKLCLSLNCIVDEELGIYVKDMLMCA